MTSTTIIYALGTVLGLAFLGTNFLGKKNKDYGEVLFTLTGKYRMMFFATMLGVIATSVVILIKDFAILDLERVLSISYWNSLLYILVYVQSRNVIVTDKGIGYMDVYGKVSNIFFEYAALQTHTITQKSAVFRVLNGKSNFKVKLAVNLRKEEVEEVTSYVKSKKDDIKESNKINKKNTKPNKKRKK